MAQNWHFWRMTQTTQLLLANLKHWQSKLVSLFFLLGYCEGIQIWLNRALPGNRVVPALNVNLASESRSLYVEDTGFYQNLDSGTEGNQQGHSRQKRGEFVIIINHKVQCFLEVFWIISQPGQGLSTFQIIFRALVHPSIMVSSNLCSSSWVIACIQLQVITSLDL